MMCGGGSLQSSPGWEGIKSPRGGGVKQENSYWLQQMLKLKALDPFIVSL